MLLACVIKYLYSGWNKTWFCEPSSENYFALLRILYPFMFMKSFVYLFVDITLTSLNKLFISFV